MATARRTSGWLYSYRSRTQNSKSPARADGLIHRLSWAGDRKHPAQSVNKPGEPIQGGFPVNDNYSSLSTTIKTHCDTGLVFYIVSVVFTVSNPLGQPLRRSGVFGAARRQRRSGAEAAGGRAGSAAALFLRAWQGHGVPIQLQKAGV